MQHFGLTGGPSSFGPYPDRTRAGLCHVYVPINVAAICSIVHFTVSRVDGRSQRNRYFTQEKMTNAGNRKPVFRPISTSTDGRLQSRTCLAENLLNVLSVRGTPQGLELRERNDP